MKVLLTTDIYLPQVNGVITSILTLRRMLEQKGHDVRILTLGESSVYDAAEKVYYLSSLEINHLYPGARVSLAVNRSVLAKIINWAPDVVHSQSEFSALHAAKLIARERDVPLVHTYHTAYEEMTCYFSPTKRSGRQIASWLSDRLLRSVDLLIAPTEKIRRMLLGYGVKPPVVVIPTGIELKKFQEPILANWREQKLHELGLVTNVPTLLYVGRLAQEKNIQEVLHYLSQNTDLTWQLLVVGDGPYRADLEDLTERLALDERVTFMGKVPADQVATCYHLGDIFVTSSTSETQGLTYIEALASGLPLLCRNDPCLEGVLLPDYNGYMYINDGEFRHFLTTLLEDSGRRQQFSQQAEVTVSLQFSAESFATEVLGIYQYVRRRRRTQADPDLFSF